ncbi:MULTISPECIES: hypothetical protein [Burkholderiaceae]|uniref:Secreted protein n=1 Tax=Caballeronia sordidicola TaxID=196367 RepID=A0A242MPG9_CABSO|nr:MULTISPECIES: hypothetical protein [Burkholderiaceae]OTP72664.1 hypothetical protein PAMC26577_20390 [Caballeronia sordidicola]
MKALTIAIKSAGLMAIITGAVACAAQAAPTPRDVAPPPVMGNAPPPMDATGPMDSTSAASVTTGVIKQYVINPEGDVDGLLFSNDSLVRFPPNMGANVAAIAAPGDTIRVSGVPEAEGALRAREITNTRNGQSAVEQPPAGNAQRLPPSLRGVSLVKLDARGRVLKVTTAPRGEPDGVLLADGTVIKLTPPGARQFPALLQPGALVAAHGYGTRNRFGQSLQATSFGTPGNLTQLYGRAD